MTHKLTYDKSAVVAPQTKWIPIDDETPIGSKMLLIEKAQGIAYLRTHFRGDGFTHWCGLPVWPKEVNDASSALPSPSRPFLSTEDNVGKPTRRK